MAVSRCDRARSLEACRCARVIAALGALKLRTPKTLNGYRLRQPKRKSNQSLDGFGRSLHAVCYAAERP